jgi:hypothetical protein
MTEEELSRAVEHSLSDLLLSISNLQQSLKAHKEVVNENAPQLKALIANRVQILGGPERAQKIIRLRTRAVELVRGRRYQDLAELLGAVTSGSVEESDLLIILARSEIT